MSRLTSTMKKPRMRPDGQPVASAICKVCGQKKTGTRNRCKPCCRAKESARRAADIERHRASERTRNAKSRAKPVQKAKARAGDMRRNYGLSLTEYLLIEGDQDGLCAICGDRVATHVDHDHRNGFVRALLCLTCNSGLGQFRDRPDLLRAAADYLENCARIQRILNRTG